MNDVNDATLPRRRRPPPPPLPPIGDFEESMWSLVYAKKMERGTRAGFAHFVLAAGSEVNTLTASRRHFAAW